MKLPILFITFFVISIQKFNSQIVGGRDNGEMSPKSVEGSKLSAGSVVSDVNILNGEYTSSIPIGKIGTPGGLNYSLSLDYSSNMSVGTSASVASGIPYGEGWGLSLPTISIEADVFHKYLLSQEDNQHVPCAPNDSPNSFPLNYDGPAVPNDPVNKYTGQDHGDLYWFAPQLSIPGVVSGRLIFKYLDQSSFPFVLVFGLQGFESPVEVRMMNVLVSGSTSSKWTVILSDGTKYLFDLVQNSYNSPMNTRVLTYDGCNSSQNNAIAVANPQNAVEGSYTPLGMSSIETNVLNNILPKQSSAVWYCTKITNNTIENQEIVLEYDKYGKFNFYNEFSPLNAQNSTTGINNTLDNAVVGDFSTYKDVILKKIVSKVDTKLFETIELDYQTLTEAITDYPNILIDPTATNYVSGIHDNMYSWRSVYSKGTTQNFSNWSRYSHIKAGEDYSEMLLAEENSISSGNNTIDPSNPYVNHKSTANGYRRTGGQSGFDFDFKDGFLESERISPQLMIPGDIYEIRSKIKNTRGTVDIALVTGDLNKTPFSPLSTFFPNLNTTTNGWYPESNYESTRGIELFSTFNMAFKWWRQLSSTYTNELRTSSFFVMPNVPSAYEGCHLQIGPGNSDVDYSTIPQGLWNLSGQEPKFEGKDTYCFMTIATNNQPNLLYKSGANLPHNFGNGFPWSMTAPLYERMELWNTLDSDQSMFQCWYMNGFTYGQNAETISKHRPTTMGYQDLDRTPAKQAKLDEIELIRYSKNPYMLQGVRIYRVNNGNETTGKQLISLKEIDYTYITKNLIENYDYYNYSSGSVPVVEDVYRKRIVFLLSKVHDLPLNATLYALNFGLSNPSQVLTTSFAYTDANTSSASSLYEVRGEKIHVLSSIVNPLGGVTTVLYQPITNNNFTNNYDPQKSTFAVQNGNSSYGDGALYNVSVIVNQVSKQDNGSNQTWSYSFSNPIQKHNQFVLNTNHFRNGFVQSLSRGFKNVRITKPIVNGISAYTDIEHHGALLADFPTISTPTPSPTTNASYYSDLENICFGKVKSSKDFMNGELNNETNYTYALTQAFENGAIRPSYGRFYFTFDADMTKHYLYSDYYLPQSNFFSLSENPIFFNSHYQHYNPDLQSLEQPKMMEGYFYSDLLSANQDRAWLFNSYFVKLTSSTTKQYEDGEYKIPTASPEICFDRNGLQIPCPIVVIEPSSCSSEVSYNRRFIEIKTDYTYFEADYKGQTIGNAYHKLLAIDPINPKTINFSNYGLGSRTKSQGIILLKHEPSWQIASIKTTSPQIGNSSNEEEFFYYYDLINRYDRHWFLYDIENNPNFAVQIINSDTIAVNNIVSTVMRANNYSLPRYEGLESARLHNTRSLAFQKTTHTKNASDSKALSKSEYYHFDNSWTYTNAQSFQPVFLRSVAVQIDTLLTTNGTFDFRTGRIDRDNYYIADFKSVTSAVQPDGKSYIHSMLSPFDQLKSKKITQRNRLLQPSTIENQMGIKTCYNFNTSVAADGTLMNLGLVESVTIGCSRADYMLTTFEYNNQGLISKLTDPDARFVEYEYDNYLRLKKTTENGTRVLSEMNYNVWDKNTSATFDQRTNQNNTLLTIYNSASTNDKEMLKSFVDPLGREHSTLQAYYDLSNNLVKTHSSTVEYDSWNRNMKTYKSYSGVGTTLDLSSNVTTPFLQVQYDDQLSSRVIKSADYGLSIATSVNTAQSSSKLVNGVIAYCELSLTNEEAKVMMTSAGNGGGFYFLKQTTTDQDGKQTVTYTNAFGQLAAKMNYTNTGAKAVTIFGYDSYGNVNKIINPNDQLSTYLYNILGQLVMETSIDGGTKRYMYNKLGLVSVEQDQLERTRVISSVFTPRYRINKYDDYGKLIGRGLMNVSLVNGQQYDPLYYSTILIGNQPSPAFDYLFSNASTYDWLCSYTITNKTIGTARIIVSPATFSIQTWEKSFSYGINPALNSIGKLILENSFSNANTKILKNSYTYDAIGNIASQLSTFSPINADGTTNVTVSKIDYPNYNYRHSLLEEKVDVNNDNTVDLHLYYGYDRLNRLTEIRSAMGSVATANDATLLVSYTYDIEGKLTKKQHLIDDNSALNRLAMEMAYSYDVRNRLTQIDAQNATVSVAKYKLFYDNQVPVSGANSVVHSTNWNGNINGVLMEYNFGTANNAVSTFLGTTLYGYQYDAMNRMTIADAAIGDFISQNATQGPLIGDEQATYDLSGNITVLKRSIRGVLSNFAETEWWNYNYQSGTNKLTGVTGQNAYSQNRSYSYDVNGNALTDSYKGIAQPIVYGRAAYAFNIKKGTDIIDYLYDTKDQRVYKKLDATDNFLDKEEYYLQDAMGRTVAIKEVQNSVTSWEYYITGSEREMSIKPTLAQTPGSNASNTAKRVGFSQTTAYVYDHLGNTRVSYTSTSWDVTNTRVLFNVNYVADYAPYGKVIREFIAANGEKAKYLTTQHERDNETGLDYRGARYYDSDVARFLSTDPWQNKYPSWSTYNYVMSNPIIFIDPTGKGVEGDYYNSAGKWLGSDGKKDDKAYIADSKSADGKSFVNAKKLSIGNTELLDRSTWVFGESGGSSENITKRVQNIGDASKTADARVVDYYASAINNGAIKSGGFYKGIKTYMSKKVNGETTNTSEGYFTGDGVGGNTNSKAFANARETGMTTLMGVTNAQNAISAVISSVNGGADPTGGARVWLGGGDAKFYVNNPSKHTSIAGFQFSFSSGGGVYNHTFYKK